MESSGTIPNPQPTTHSSIPTIAGVFLLITGILGLLLWVLVAFVGGLIGFNMIPGTEGAEAFISGFFVVCAVIGLIFSIIALLGGLMAIQRKNWAFALIGSILGLFTIGPFLISSILSLIALILIMVSRNDFM